MTPTSFVEMPRIIMTRIVTLPNSDQTVFIIGGSTTAREIRARNNCYKYQKGFDTSLQEIAPLLTAWANFGVLVIKNGKEIVIAGGDINTTDHTNEVEAYNIEDNEWWKLPPLVEKKATPGIVSMNDKILFCFGGLLKQNKSSLSTIEMLDLEIVGTKWKKLEVRLPWDIADPGALQTSEDEILIFGGWNQSMQQRTTVMKYSASGAIQFFCNNDSMNLEQPDFFNLNPLPIRTETGIAI
jgi:hypothetical protein